MKSFTWPAALVVSAVCSGAAFLFLNQGFGQPSFPSSTPPTSRPAKATPPTRVAANSAGYRDGSYTGPTADAYYGAIRVQAHIQGGRIVSINVLRYPSDNWTSRSINSQALPYLESEVIQAQGVSVDMISGATLSSAAFLRSTYGALRHARG